MNMAGPLLQSGASPPSDRDQEADLWRRFAATKDRRTREQLFTFYYPFARQIARRRYFDRAAGDIELPDLCQMAFGGLLEAIDHFDPQRGAVFRGYAAKRISGAIIDGVAKVSELRQQISFRNRMRRDRIASLIDRDVDKMSAMEAMEALIDAAIGLAIGFMLEGEAVNPSGERSVPATAYDSAVWKETIHRLTTELHALPDRERAVIRHHYLEGMTVDQVGVLMGISKGRVSQIHRGALMTLKRRLAKHGDFRLER